MTDSTPDRKPCGCLKTIPCTHIQTPFTDDIVRSAGFNSEELLQVNTSVDPVSQTLAQRGSRYGDFSDNAKLSQELERVIRNQYGYGKLEPLHTEALKFIFQKISRIVNGDPNYADNWHDIQGYAKLVEERLPK